MKRIAAGIVAVAAWSPVPTRAAEPKAMPTLVSPQEDEALPVQTEENEEVARRAPLMVEDLGSEVHVAEVSTVYRVVAASAGGLISSASLYAAVETKDPMFYWWTAAGGFWALGPLATFVANDDYTHTLITSSRLLGGGLFTLPFYRGRMDDFSPYAVGGISGAFFLAGALNLAAATLRRPVSAAKLAADYEIIRSPQRRRDLSLRRLARIELDFRRTVSPLPPWLLATPWLAGGSLALGAAFADSHPSDVPRTLEGLTGALFLGIGVATLLPLAGYRHYTKVLAENGLCAYVDATPGRGVSLHFDATF